MSSVISQVSNEGLVVDEAMRKLEELARRQEREMRRQAAQRRQQGLGRPSQEALVEAVDELPRACPANAQ